MEKNLKKVKTIAVVLIIVLLATVAFGGLYLREKGSWNNVIPKFSYGMELNGFRELRFVLDTTEEEKEVYVDSEGKIVGEVIDKDSSANTEVNLVDENGNPIDNSEETTEADETNDTTEENTEEDPTAAYTTEERTIKANEDSAININNFEKTKKIIQNRLESLTTYEYNIRMDNVTGDLVVEVPDDNEAVTIQQSLITTVGNFKITDAQNGLILLDESYIESASPYEYNNQVYLIIQFNKEGTEKLREISNKYTEIKTTENTTTEDAQTTEGTQTTGSQPETKDVSIMVDDNTLATTYFGQEIQDGMLQLSLGQATTDENELLITYNQIGALAKAISNEKLPLVYQLKSDNYVRSSVTDEMKTIAIVVFAVICVILSILLIVKFKGKGLKLSIFNIGYIAILVLVIKYTRVLVTLNSAIAFLSVVILSYILYYKLLKKMQNISEGSLQLKDTLKEYYIQLVPVCIIAIVFAFMSGTIISSVGMVLFWGLFLQVLYNSLLSLINVL